MTRIGQILCASVPLSDHDIEEILHEQKTTRQRFGDVALALGKVKPEHVWAAWLTQMRSAPVNLDRVPVDAATTAAVPSAVAWTHGLIPLRVRGDELVIAVADSVTFEAVTTVERITGRRVIAVAAEAGSLGRALMRCYPMPSAPAA